MIHKVKQNKDLWDILTRKEEYSPASLDQHQRFAHRFSQQKNIKEPLVSKFLIEQGLKIDYPQGKSFAVCLTHDIDVVRLSWLGTIKKGFEYFFQSKIKDFLKTILSLSYQPWNPWWSFDKIIALEKKYKARSTFFFLADESRYKINSLRKLLRAIDAQGWEIGLHGGDKSFNNPEQLKKEKQNLETALGKKIIGYRSHHLRFLVPQTWELLAGAGFNYDSTLGYPDAPGWRAGLCHPFRPFNLNTQKEINILEIPLTLMDATLKQQKIDMEKSWQIIQDLIDTTAKYQGVLVVLWHNNFFSEPWLDLYEKILSYASSKNAWLTSGQEIYNFWASHQEMFSN